MRRFRNVKITVPIKIGPTIYTSLSFQWRIKKNRTEKYIQVTCYPLFYWTIVFKLAPLRKLFQIEDKLHQRMYGLTDEIVCAAFIRYLLHLHAYKTTLSYIPVTAKDFQLLPDEDSWKNYSLPKK